MKVRRITCALIIAAATVSWLACGMSHSPAPAIAVQFQPTPPTSIDTGAYAAISAVVTNDNQFLGVSFSCTPLNSCGIFTPAQTASNVPVCYLAPATVPAGNTVTITATSVSDTSKFKSATITVLNGAPVPCP